MFRRLYQSTTLFVSNPSRVRQTIYIALTLAFLATLILGAGHAMADGVPGGPYPTP
jgi:hypothetical protein